MAFTLRVAGFAAATMLLAAGAGLSGASLAEESQAVPVTAHYSDHAFAAPAADLAASTLVEEPADTLDQPVQLMPAVITVQDPAPLLPEVSTSPVEEEREQPKTLRELVNEHASSQVPDAELECLAGAVYFEAKSEPLSGQLAVAEVIINRAKSGRFPASFCGVVKQRGQFSFIRAGRFPPIPRSSLQWQRAVAIAHIASKELASGGAPRALFFHARHVAPRWRLTRVAAVGNHIFYR